jgi:hypothetical protein
LLVRRPGLRGVRHKAEIEGFAEVARADGVRFQSTTYQDVIVRLARNERDRHRDYINYLAARYL